MKLYITRHGQTDWNMAKIIQGKSDISLNDTGKKQAQITRDALASVPIDAIIVSPLKRAKQTAAIINEPHQAMIYEDARIEERGFGRFEGKGLDLVDFTRFWSIAEETQFPDCEKTSVFYERVYDFINECKQKAADLTLLIVAHGGVSLPFYTYFNGMPPVGDMRKYMLDNCEVATYEWVAEKC